MKKRKKKDTKNSKRQELKVFVLKLEQSLTKLNGGRPVKLKDKHYWKVGGTI